MEAKELIDCGGGFSVADTTSLEKKIDELLSDSAYLEHAGNAAGKYISDHVGATRKILSYIQANRLLTR
jgi:3-deoxy-D-manno-octulosonic-acid transferase